ncbi:L-allo-threonine aldolase [Planctomycetes bacterium Poly30]|uniref:L-allo-threonine aldolase n=1 Tax=Saltatorellus ferox TaxID=2528018 RepID=A0A518ESP1_9BACT|nr:L-allo-threonine aldolase [Planctomycetes bacterium Poly30]
MRADFRSDTVTQPSAAMRAVMLDVPVGDDVLDGDPTVRLLEDEAAAWLGKPRALFVPSGTMANQVALGAWTRPGDEIVCQRWSHITTYEGGAPGYLHGVQTLTIGNRSGRMDPAEVAEAIRPNFIHCPSTALICLEQTHNVAGGVVIPMEEFAAVAAVGRERGIPVHLDGARLANAVVASGISAPDWTAHVDSVSLCLSKGLGAPVGSIVAGDDEFIERAMRVRKRLGGWMRQAGFLASAARMALRDNVSRMTLDHALARKLGERLGTLPGLTCDASAIETNMAMVHVAPEMMTAAAFAEALAAHDVHVLPMGPQVLRFVTHLDVGSPQLEQLVTAAQAVTSEHAPVA